MPTDLKTAKILTSGNLSDRFLETKIYEPTNAEEREFGNSYILIEVNTPWFPTAKIGKTIRDTFLEEYYQKSTSSNISKRFEDGLKTVNKKLSDLAGSGQTEWIGNLNAIIATIRDQKLYLSFAGSAEAYLFRKNKISHITENIDVPRRPVPIQTFPTLISGQIQKGDRLVFSNSEMYNFVSIDTLRSAVSQISPNHAADEIVQILLKERAKKINAIFVYIKGKGEIDAKAAASLPDTVFLDSEDDVVRSPLGSDHFRFRKLGPKAKILITSLGFFVLGLTKRIKPLMRQKEETKPIPEDPSKEKEKDLSYLSSSINLNLSKERTKKEGGALKKTLNLPKRIFQALSQVDKKWLYGVLAVILIILIVVGLSVRASRNEGSRNLSEVVAQAQDKINSAETQIALHNEEGAKVLVLEAKDLLGGIKDDPKAPLEVVLLLEKTNELMDKINKVIRISNPKHLASLASLNSNVASSEICYLNGVIYSINGEGQEIFGVIAGTGDKSVQAEIPESAGKISHLTYFDNERVLVIQTSTGQIFEYDITRNKIQEKETPKDEDFVKGLTLDSYLTTIYLLNQEDQGLYKYSRTAGGYGRPRLSYKEGVVNLTDVVSTAIDGNIYLLHSSGVVEKTLKGVIETDFAISGIPEPNSNLSEPNKIYTNIDTNSLYVLESHRIVEFNKNGEYLRQFAFGDDIREIQDFVVNEKTNKLYVLASNDIFEIDL